MEINKTEIGNTEDREKFLFNKAFDHLPLGQFMYLPMSMLHPITIDDYKDSHTDGPLEVFRKGEKIFIDDGNHRYFTKQRDLIKESGSKEPDYNKVMMKIIKVDPKKAINSWMLDH